MFQWFEWFIRTLHIVSGVAMVGGIFMWGGVIMPSVQERLPPQVRGAFMKELFPRVSYYITAAGATAIVTGLWTMGLIVGFRGIVPVMGGTAYGYVLAGGLVAVVAMMAIGWAVIYPAGTRLLAMAEKAPPGAPMDGPPPPEVQALQKRLAVAGIANLVLGLATLLLMAAAVNLRV